MTDSTTLLFVVVVGMAAFIHSITGFGFALFALGILGWWVDVRDVSIMLSPAAVVVSAMIFVRLRAHFSWDGVLPLFLAVLVSVPAGALFLLHVDMWILEVSLAGIMLFSGLQGLVPLGRLFPSTWDPLKVGIPCGLVGGLLTGAFGIGGMPIVSYLLHRPLNRLQFNAAMQALLGLAALVRVGQFAANGHLNHGRLSMILPSIVAAVGGVSLGVRVLHRLSDALVRKMVLFFVVGCGLRYLWMAAH